jgi:putative radical SAM enzyme (TIGR03279 family)
MPVLSPLSHRRVDLVPSATGIVSAVAPGSLAAELGIAAGDRIVSINGQPVLDALDFQFQAQSQLVTFEVEQSGVVRAHELALEGDEFWGITFADPTFDGVRLCENACPFCFIKQIPKGMRKSLYVMDDDFRYSMLYGNFVTLTNLDEADWERIEREKISPMHVSVHATNPELRVALVGNPKGGKIMEDLGRLQRAGIDFHAQLVLVPGVNDGAEMDRSLEDLAQFERLLSIAAVPVGLTRYGLERQSKQVRLSRTCMRTLPGKQISVRRYEADEALAVIAQAEAWQRRFRAERGETFFHLGDEFYLMCDRQVPEADHYDGYPQIEDGIGITRHLLENLDGLIRRTKAGSLAGASGTVATATLIGPTMREAVDRFNRHTGARLDVAIVENTFFGTEINVSGLLTGQDLIANITRREPGVGPVYVSNRMISDRTQTLMDDMTIAGVSEQLGRQLVPCGLMSDVARDLRLRLRNQHAA